MKVLTHLCAVTMNPDRDIIEDACICIEGDRIVAVCPTAEMPEPFRTAEHVDCSGKVVVPGMINTHTHLFQTLLKGLGDDMDLKKWFSCMTGPAAVHLTTEDMATAALHGCVESLMSGVTTLVEYQYVNTQDDMIDAVYDSFDQTGIRGFVCRGFMTTGEDHGVPPALIEKTEHVIEHTRAAARCHNRPGGRVQIGIAPCMCWTVDPDAYRAVRKLADEEGLFITAHLSENAFEVERAKESFGTTTAQFFDEIGFLGPDVLAVHCVHCNSRDIRLMKMRDVKVSHNPCSMLYVGLGVAPIPEMLAAGLTVSLGSDGPASNNNHSIFHVMKFAALVPKGVHEDPTIMTAEKALEMATIDGARAVGLEDEIGSLEPGKKADLAIMDLSESIWATPLHRVPSAIVYSALGHEVTDVMVDGTFVIRNRQHTVLNIKDLRAASQKAADGLAGRAGVDHFKTRPWRSVTA